MTTPSTLLPPALMLLVMLFGSQASALERIEYSGELRELARNGQATAVKEFQVECVLNSETGTACTLVSESPFALPWCEQFSVSQQADPAQLSTVAIAYEHQGRDYVLPVTLPYFADFEQLTDEANWTSNGIEYEVLGDEKIQDVECWKVRLKTGVARYQTLSVRKDRPLIVAGKQTVFMGQGDKFEIVFTSSKISQIDQEAGTQLVLVHNALLELKRLLKRDPNNRTAPLTTVQVEISGQHSPALVALAKETSLTSFVNSINDDIMQRSQRKDRVEDLGKAMLGKPTPKFTLTQQNGTPLTSDALKGHVVVLHFWDYKETPLEQPYGQIGYLDFLKNRWAEKQVGIYGVAVDSRLMNPETLNDGLRSINKLRQFMKLGYEITYDSGSVLNTFGNPTRLGEELPLWVVLDQNGNVAFYQTGYFTIDPLRGLKELDEIIENLVTR